MVIRDGHFPSVLPIAMRNRILLPLKERINLHPEINRGRLLEAQAHAVGNFDVLRAAVELVCAVRHSSSVKDERGAVNRAVVVIAARIICIAVEWIVRDKIADLRL